MNWDSIEAQWKKLGGHQVRCDCKLCVDLRTEIAENAPPRMPPLPASSEQGDVDELALTWFAGCTITGIMAARRGVDIVTAERADASEGKMSVVECRAKLAFDQAEALVAEQRRRTAKKIIAFVVLPLLAWFGVAQACPQDDWGAGVDTSGCYEWSYNWGNPARGDRPTLSCRTWVEVAVSRTIDTFAGATLADRRRAAFTARNLCEYPDEAMPCPSGQWVCTPRGQWWWPSKVLRDADLSAGLIDAVTIGGRL